MERDLTVKRILNGPSRPRNAGMTKKLKRQCNETKGLKKLLQKCIGLEALAQGPKGDLRSFVQNVFAFEGFRKALNDALKRVRRCKDLSGLIRPYEL